MKKAISTFLFAALFAAIAQGSPVLMLTPTDVEGAPGSTVGWGFTLSNDTSDFLLVTGAAFTPNPAPLGTFQDFISAVNLTLVGPDSALSQQFDPVAQTGVGAFQIASFVPFGTLIKGDLLIDYTLFSGDPTSDPTATLVVADASIATATSVYATPEPAYLPLLALAALPLLAGLRRRRKAAEGL